MGSDIREKWVILQIYFCYRELSVDGPQRRRHGRGSKWGEAEAPQKKKTGSEWGEAEAPQEDKNDQNKGRVIGGAVGGGGGGGGGGEMGGENWAGREWATDGREHLKRDLK